MEIIWCKSMHFVTKTANMSEMKIQNSKKKNQNKNYFIKK